MEEQVLARDAVEQYRFGANLMLTSIVIPCFNNQDEIESTVSAICQELLALPSYSFELILVDDASEDGTWSRIRELSANLEPDIRGIRLAKNEGAYAALLSGFASARGQAVLVMAADGDDPPGLVPKLISKFTPETDLVQAARIPSQRRWDSRFFGKLFLACLNTAGAKNIPTGGCDFALFSSELVRQAASCGWKNGNTLIQVFQFAQHVEVIHYAKGRSKPSSWTFAKKMRLFVQTVNQFLRWKWLLSAFEKTEIVETC